MNIQTSEEYRRGLLFKRLCCRFSLTQPGTRNKGTSVKQGELGMG